MKNAKFFASKSSLLAVGLLSASAALIALPAKAETVQLTLNDATNTNTSKYPTVSVTLDDTSNPGKITATVNVVAGSTGYIGDLRGVYFDLPGVSGLTISPVSGGPLTNISTDGDFSDFGNSADLDGVKASFSAGVEVGKQGISKGDDYQSTTFTISGEGLTLSSFSTQTIGARLMSVGDPGGKRELSSKTAGTAPVIVASNPSTGTSGGGSAPAEETASTGGGTAPADDAGSTGGGTVPVGDTGSTGGETAEAPASGGETAPAPSSGGETAPAPGGETAGTPAPGGDVASAPSGEPSGTPAPSSPGPRGDAEQVPEPTTMAGSALGLAALMKWRKNRKASKSN